MPEHQQLLVTGSGPGGHQRLETRVQPSPAALIAGLPTASPLRCHLYPPMNDSRSPWTSSRGPVTTSGPKRAYHVTVTIAASRHLLMANNRTRRETGAYHAGPRGPIPYGDVTNPTTAARRKAFVR